MTSHSAAWTGQREGVPARGSAEEVILWLAWVIIGDGSPGKGRGTDRGLMTRIHRGQQHVPTCQKGYYVREGDSQRGGQPCSERCERARQGIEMAERWLRAQAGEIVEPEPMQRTQRRQQPARQPSMFDEVAG